MGLAIDFGLPGKPHSAIRTSSKELQWLRTNAEKFGFKDTAMPKEDWHWQYVK
jgi:LAS superfamily LD-carboxypeptidase LdcB